MISWKHFWITLFCLSLLNVAVLAAAIQPFSQMSPIIQKALLVGDTVTLQQHVDLKGIVRGKIKRLANQASKSNGWQAKLLGQSLKMGEGPLVKIVTDISLREFKKSPRSQRQGFLQQLKITRAGNQGELGFARGSFMGAPLYISAVRNNNTWIIIDVESAIIDRELNNLLQSLKK